MKKGPAPLDPARMTATLRAGVLAIGPADIGLDPATAPLVHGLMLEMAETETVSLVALADGSVSIYLGNGGGVIGCGLHPDVRVAASKLLKLASQAVDMCIPTTEYPPPDPLQVRVYLLTGQGVLVGDASREELDEGAVGLAEVYYAAHGLIGMVELLGAGVDLVDEMRLAESALLRTTDNEAVQALKARGRGCRILPYVGNAVRRSRN